MSKRAYHRLPDTIKVDDLLMQAYEEWGGRGIRNRHQLLAWIFPGVHRTTVTHRLNKLRREGHAPAESGVAPAEDDGAV